MNKPATPSPLDAKRIRRARRVDALMRRIITLGGVTVVAAVVGILALILREAAPLLSGADATGWSDAVPSGPLSVAALAVDRSLHGGAPVVGVLSSDGRVIPHDAAPALSVLEEERVHSPDGDGNGIVAAFPERDGFQTLLWRDGALSRVRFRTGEGEGAGAGFHVVLEHEGLGPARLGALSGDDTEGAAAVFFADGRAMVRRWTTRREGLRRRKVEAEFALAVPGNLAVSVMAMTRAGDGLVAGTRTGELIAWDWSEAAAVPLEGGTTPVNRSRRPVTAVAWLAGDAAVAVGEADGTVSVWHRYRDEARLRWRRAQTWPGAGVAVTALLPSGRDRTLAVCFADGGARLVYTTNGRVLLDLPGAPDPPAATAPAQWAFSPRGDALIRNAGGRLDGWAIDNPHPEAGWRGYFARLLYEGYDRPAWVWQSTGTEDAEPKLSLVPLLFGTAKGTFYAMLFAVPLALLAAVYVSQFAAPAVRGWVKPAVELMAAAPSVVVGFLAALWLAPLLEKRLLAIPLAAAGLGLLAAVAGVARRVFAQRRAGRAGRGWEFFPAGLAVLAVLAVAWGLAEPLDAAWFEHGAARWLYDALGLRYDQRNSLVIAFALGFAVIPVVFSLAEDALSTVPPSLAAAALALGASRWQAVRRVVAPAAAPGLFAAVMIGFGRAVGETMIVLMATGNTPILDPSPFNGMRTLAANIAVEMPEAPVGSTLYRTLFLCAVLLFCCTFALNTLADWVRRRLRKKAGRL